MKKHILAIAALATFASLAQAADPSPLTANFSLTTNYKYRGQDQSDNKPAVQGGFDYTMGGFYVGNWNSSIGFTNAGIEMDFYGGYKGEAAGISYDVGLLQYAYPSLSTANTTELYGQVGWQFLSAKYSHTVSSKYFGLVGGRGTGYLDLGANYEVMKGLTLNAHLGFTRFDSDAKANGGVNYDDYKLGATYDLGSGFSVAGAVVGANKKNVYGDINKARFILTLTKAM